MTISYTSLVHGLDVRTCDLVVAARAFASLEPIWDAIAEVQQQRHDHAARTINTNQLPATYRIPVEVWDMVKQFAIDTAVFEMRGAVQVELSCGECHRREVDWRVGTQAPEEDGYELEEFVAAQVSEEARRARERSVRTMEWADGDVCRHNSAAKDYAAFRAQGLHSKPLARLLASSGLYLPTPTSKGIARPLVKSSFTTTLALQLPRATVHQVRSAFEFSPFTLCRSSYEPGPLEDSDSARPAVKLGPAVKDCGRLEQFLRKWHFGSPTMVIGPAEYMAGPGESSGGGRVALMGRHGEAFRPRWIVAASDED